jgi:hypothetical protein
MNNYIDQFGRYHNKPVTPSNQLPSNNAWIYSAYAQKIGLPLDIDYGYALDCAKYFTRHNLIHWPPFSRDEALGMVYLGYMPAIAKDWYFSTLITPKFNLLKTIATFVLAIGEHRNFLWEKDLRHSYRFMFSVPLSDRAWIYREIYNSEPIAIYRLIEWLDKRLIGKSNSGKLIRWLKYDILPETKVFIEYFGEEHPITKIRINNGI